VVFLIVQPGSSAERAGLRPTIRAANGRLIPGDVILKIGDRDVKNVQDYFAALGRFNVGEQVTLTVYRQGETVQVPVTLEGEAQARE
jgi:S1-C subfamily serine protease